MRSLSKEAILKISELWDSGTWDVGQGVERSVSAEVTGSAANTDKITFTAPGVDDYVEEFTPTSRPYYSETQRQIQGGGSWRVAPERQEAWDRRLAEIRDQLLEIEPRLANPVPYEREKIQLLPQNIIG